jgi:hypothetical protein
MSIQRAPVQEQSEIRRVIAHQHHEQDGTQPHSSLGIEHWLSRPLESGLLLKLVEASFPKRTLTWAPFSRFIGLEAACGLSSNARSCLLNRPGIAGDRIP